jgi:hypothetical protein
MNYQKMQKVLLKLVFNCKLEIFLIIFSYPENRLTAEILLVHPFITGKEEE